MARKDDLRSQRENTVINKKSKTQEGQLDLAINNIEKRLKKEFPNISIERINEWYLLDIVNMLKKQFPSMDFHCHFKNSSMKPDGGILRIKLGNGEYYPILIAEKKNQGANDVRKREGKPKQAKGNAIEGLGKNVIGFRTAMIDKPIFPFVCFGDGCDFDESSSILDRVVTIAQFGHLNKICLHNKGPNGEFNRGSFFFRVKEWERQEMEDIGYEIAERSVLYYLSKYGKKHFLSKQN